METAKWYKEAFGSHASHVLFLELTMVTKVDLAVTIPH